MTTAPEVTATAAVLNAARDVDGDSRQVNMVCGTKPVASGAWANTPKGLIQTGLESTDAIRWAVVPGATCP